MREGRGKGEEGREGRRKDGRVILAPIPFVKNLGDKQPREAITQYVLFYLL